MTRLWFPPRPAAPPAPIRSHRYLPIVLGLSPRTIHHELQAVDGVNAKVAILDAVQALQR